MAHLRFGRGRLRSQGQQHRFKADGEFELSILNATDAKVGFPRCGGHESGQLCWSMVIPARLRPKRFKKHCGWLMIPMRKIRRSRRLRKVLLLHLLGG